MENFANTMSNAIGAPLAVFLLAMIPLAEARVAILLGVRMGLSPLEAFGWAFLGSSMLAPILLLVLIPTINALARTKVFSKVGKFLYDKFEKKSHSLARSEEVAPTEKKCFVTKSDIKKMGGTALFVAVPIPMTGVWTGCAVASIIKIGFVKGLIGIIVGNAVACGILTLIGYLFLDYLDYIIYAFIGIVFIVIAVLIVKFIMYKPPADNKSPDNDVDNVDKDNK